MRVDEDGPPEEGVPTEARGVDVPPTVDLSVRRVDGPTHTDEPLREVPPSDFHDRLELDFLPFSLPSLTQSSST